MIQIRTMRFEDYPTIAMIYQQGIDTRNATFEKSAPAKWKDFSDRFLNFSKCIAVLDNQVVGWGALSSVSSRCVYAGVCEVSVYVHELYRGLRIGSTLLRHLINESEKEKYWTIQAGIFPENEASVKLHTALGFRIVGSREKIGKMDEVWRDTLLLERRSRNVGVAA